MPNFASQNNLRLSGKKGSWSVKHFSSRRQSSIVPGLQFRALYSDVVFLREKSWSKNRGQASLGVKTDNGTQKYGAYFSLQLAATHMC